ncbi:nicotinate-nucleotide adenylyltransferase [Paenibacillus glufosinatiresistens]|uniref:nicotinate-nucleotide adenylyltransferase n=1 Tax=Paenibacillus glufosinatiresistens TaxID=3070657 RepID=UPI00286E581F|nr:nicotinate-nucleotide adenylyltransferase [Paenibacillus sp. YX.27]
MKVGIMGGAFDPIHVGHLLAAETAREACGLDEVWFMPSHVPPHKQASGVSGEERLAMVEAAVKSHPAFRSLDLELRKGGVSYTIETVRLLQERHPDVAFYFIIGADMVAYLPKWKEIGELARRLRFIGVARPGTPLDLDALPPEIAGSVTVAGMPQMDISSTAIRRRAAEGRSIRYLVPDAVHDLVSRRGLYGVQP